MHVVEFLWNIASRGGWRKQFFTCLSLNKSWRGCLIQWKLSPTLSAQQRTLLELMASPWASLCLHALPPTLLCQSAPHQTFLHHPIHCCSPLWLSQELCSSPWLCLGCCCLLRHQSGLFFLLQLLGGTCSSLVLCLNNVPPLSNMEEAALSHGSLEDIVSQSYISNGSPSQQPKPAINRRMSGLVAQDHHLRFSHASGVTHLKKGMGHDRFCHVSTEVAGDFSTKSATAQSQLFDHEHINYIYGQWALLFKLWFWSTLCHLLFPADPKCIIFLPWSCFVLVLFFVFLPLHCLQHFY